MGIDTSGSVSLSGLTSGSTVSVGGTVIGTLANDITGGGNLVINFNANSTAAAVETLIRALTYENTNTDNPTGGAFTVRLTVNDGDGATTADTDITVNLSAVNDAPVNTVPASVNATEDTLFSFTGANTISVNDVETDAFTTQLSVNNGVLNVSLTGGATISAGSNNSTTLTLSGTQAEINSALASLTYQPDSNFNGPDTLTVTTTETATTPALNDTDSITINVASVNDAPVNTVPASVNATEDTAFAFTGGNTISVTDLDGNLAKRP